MGKKKIILIFVAVLLLALIGGAIWLIFGNQTENIAPAENTYDPGLYSYSTYAGSPDVKVDGVLDEPVWQGKSWWKNTYLANVGGVLPKMELTAFPTQEGIYFGSKVSDSNLTSDGQRYPQKNSNWELYFAVADVGGDIHAPEYSGGWNVHKLYVDMFGEAFTLFNNIDRAVVYEGELNSGNTVGATLELFIPWQALSVDVSKGIPESFGIMPTYRAPLDNAGDTTWMSPSSSSLHNTSDMFIFDINGYTNASAEGAVLGDGYYGYAKTYGWDLSKLDTGVAVSGHQGTNKIFFTEHFGDNFIVEATLIPTGETADPWPKTGILFQKPDGQYQTIWLDPNGKNGFIDSINGTKNFPNYQITTLDSLNGGWNQTSLGGYNKQNSNAAKQEGVKLTVVKYGANFWYFADGKFLTSSQLSFMEGDCMPGFWSLGMETIFKDLSCKPLDADTLRTYLNEKDLYMIASSVEGPGGSVTTNVGSVEKGDSYELAISSKSGYRVSSVQINGQEMIEHVMTDAVGGVYTVKNITDNQQVVVCFEKSSQITFSGTAVSETGEISASINLLGITDKSLSYETEISAKKGFELKIPAGKYHMIVASSGFKSVERDIEILEDTTDTITLELSDFAKDVRVNGKIVQSNLENYDLSQEHKGKVYGSYDLGTSGQSLYFPGTGADFVVSATMNYATDFQADVEYQPDLIGGFIFNDGQNSYKLWARESGIIYAPNEWKYEMNLFGKSVLMYPNPKEAVFTVAKLGDMVYVYIDGREVYQTHWSRVAPDIAADSQLAVGLNMWTDKKAELEFSNFSITFDSDEVTQFVNSH